MEVSSRYRSWTYRYKSLVDGRMRQMQIGRWPGMSAAAVVEWERLRAERDQGGDPAAEQRHARAAARDAAEALRRDAAVEAYTVRAVCDDYLAGHIDRHRAPKGAAEARRMLDSMLGDLAALPAAALTRAAAFDLISGHAASRPVQAARLRAELGAAWDYAIDSGRLPETAADW